MNVELIVILMIILVIDAYFCYMIANQLDDLREEFEENFKNQEVINKQVRFELDQFKITKDKEASDAQLLQE